MRDSDLTLRRAVLTAGVALALGGVGWTRPPRDPGFEILDYVCENELGKRQVTLFGNGTVRLREGLATSPSMALGELTPSELDGQLARITEIDLSEVPADLPRARGEWLEECRVTLDLGEGRPVTFRFGHYDALPLPLGNLVRRAEALAERVLPARGYSLPVGYEPRLGDVLRRHDDALFEVRAFTAERSGVELQGVVEPITMLVGLHDLRDLFIELVSRPRGLLAPVGEETFVVGGGAEPP